MAFVSQLFYSGSALFFLILVSSFFNYSYSGFALFLIILLFLILVSSFFIIVVVILVSLLFPPALRGVYVRMYIIQGMCPRLADRQCLDCLLFTRLMSALSIPTAMTTR